MTSTFTCYLVGDGVLALRCAERLVEAGHRLLGIHASEPMLAEWAAQNGIAIFRECERAAFRAELLQGEHDFLFSVNNPWIIPQDVIDSARRTTVNFHDSPLPKYAGLHATSWALLHGEKQHAVTWHDVRARVDSGDIYKQAIFDIREHLYDFILCEHLTPLSRLSDEN